MPVINVQSTHASSDSTQNHPSRVPCTSIPLLFPASAQQPGDLNRNQIFKLTPEDTKLAQELVDAAKKGETDKIRATLDSKPDIIYKTNNSVCHVAARHDQVIV